MKLIAIACVNLLLLAKAAKKYVATFDPTNNGIDGTVTIDNGQVVIDIDLSDTDLMTNGFGTVSFDDCITGGLAYHIHKIWNYTDDNTDKIGGTDCGGKRTSGHWDPWQACGPASGNMYCGDGTADQTDPDCIPTSDYSPDFSVDPFSAEVGDWSAKYDKIELTAENTISRTSSSFYEVMPSEMAGLSVVFHCNSGARAFCAPFLESADAVTETIPDQATEGTVVANFDALGDGSMIKLASDGTITVNVDGVDAGALISACSSFEYSIFEAGTFDADGCSGVTEQYDPTAQCPPWSANSYCENGQLCGYTAQESYADRCDFSTARYSCAPGDLSARAGELLTVTDTYTKTISGPDTLIPPVDSLIGKVIGINCPYDVSPTLTFLACAKIEAYTTPAPVTPAPVTPAPVTPAPNDNSASISSIITAIIASFIALLF